MHEFVCTKSYKKMNLHISMCTNLYLFIGTRNFHYCENYEPQKTVFFYHLY
jgi:hypothetical protein